MNAKFLALYATLTAAFADRTRDEEGQGTLEYVGIVIVAAILVGAVVDGLANGSAITSAIQDKITEIVGMG